MLLSFVCIKFFIYWFFCFFFGIKFVDVYSFGLNCVCVVWVKVVNVNKFYVKKKIKELINRKFDVNKI